MDSSYLSGEDDLDDEGENSDASESESAVGIHQELRRKEAGRLRCHLNFITP
jgi:hypothetical protein